MITRFVLRRRARAAAILVLGLIATLTMCSSHAIAQTPPQELTGSQIRLFDAESDVVDGAFPGLLLIPKSRPNYTDEKYHQPYRLACHVYVAVPSADGVAEPIYRRRFLVCAADRDAATFARQVATFLLLLYGERRERIRDDHPENAPTVNVWLTERVGAGLSPDTGGEQFQNQIYLYNIHRERPAIEWAREIAHEYGHYALPGISGFKAPEEWANGVLGERLFLKWIREDLKAGRLKADEISFVTPGLLDDFFARIIWPLVRRILRDGMDADMITRVNAKGMDYYTGLALYVDTLYGDHSLADAMQHTSSASILTFPHASDFLDGVRRALQSEMMFALTLPALGSAEKENMIYFYLPAGTWGVTMEGGALSWHVIPDPRTGVACTTKTVTVRKGGWYRLAFVRSAAAPVPARLVFRRRE